MRSYFAELAAPTPTVFTRAHVDGLLVERQRCRFFVEICVIEYPQHFFLVSKPRKGTEVSVEHRPGTNGGSESAGPENQFRTPGPDLSRPEGCQGVKAVVN